MVRETSGTATDAVLYPIPLPELGAGLWAHLPYRVRLAPVSRGARRLYVVHVYALERVGHLIRFRHLVATGKRTAPAHLTVPASRIVAVEPLDWGDRERAMVERQRRTLAPAEGSDDTRRKLTLSEVGAEPNAPAERGSRPRTAGAACDVTGAPRTVRPETEHRPGSLADGPTGAARTVAPRASIVSTFEHAEVRRYGPPPALARLLVEHRAECLRPTGCDVSRSLWSELVALYGTPAALGAFYAAERWAETRRARVTIRAALAIAPATRKGAHL